MRKQMQKYFLLTLVLFVYSCKPFKPIKLPATGGSLSYYKGDDGDLRKGVKWPNPRFINHKNGTITDRLTGLMWEANPIKKHCTWEGAFKRINNLNLKKLGGYSDWRLPNINELITLINYYNPRNVKYLAEQGFDLYGTKRSTVIGNTRYKDRDKISFWSSTTIKTIKATFAYVISYATKHYYYDDKNRKRYFDKTYYIVFLSLGVRTAGKGLVKIIATGQKISFHKGDDGDLRMGVKWPNPRFINHKNGTTTDRLTGLMWQQSPSKSKYTLGGAFRWINKLNKERFAGYSDWRLPNINELKSLVSYICNQYIRRWLKKGGFKIPSNTTFLWASSYWRNSYYHVPEGLCVGIGYYAVPFRKTIYHDAPEYALAVRGPGLPR